MTFTSMAVCGILLVPDVMLVGVFAWHKPMFCTRYEATHFLPLQKLGKTISRDKFSTRYQVPKSIDTASSAGVGNLFGTEPAFLKRLLEIRVVI